MSSEGIASAIRYLAEAIRGLATEISRSRQASSSAEVPEEELGEWEVIEEQSSVPGAPSDFNATIRFEAETGPPPIPEFLLALARKKLRSTKASAEDRAAAAFSEGFWCRIGWLCNVELASNYNPVLPPTIWLIQNDQGISNLARTTSRREAERLCASIPGASVVQKFPTVTELQIFCAGAQLPVPPLVRWTSAQ